MSILKTRNWYLVLLILFSSSLYAQKKRNSADFPEKLVASIQSGSLHDFTGAVAGLKNPDAYADRKKKHTVLTLSVALGRLEMVNSLLQLGADPNFQVRGKSPLIFAVTTNNIAIARRLLNHGANPNLADQQGRVPLHFLLPRGNVAMARLLIEYGARANAVDQKGRSVFTDLNPEKHPDLYGYLQSKAQIQGASAMWPSMMDGPYVFDVDSSVVQVSWFFHDSLQKISYRRDTFLSGVNQTRLFNRISATWQPLELRRVVTGNCKHTMAGDTIAVVGDVHGRVVELVALLKGAGIIDEDQNWSFGTNTLVFIGDLVDRGEYVTETLWLVHNLTLQAGERGGRVEYMLGNHEELVLVGDISYVHEKQQLLWKYFDLSLSDLFSYNSYFGRWIRTRPAICNINRNLFVHAGISKELLESGMDEATINRGILRFLTDTSPVVNDTNRLLLLDKGPLWSRTYFRSYDTENTMSDSLITKTLAHFNADRIVIGHTEVPDVMTLFNGKVVTTNVPFYDVQSSRLLLIVGDGLFKVSADGKKEKISLESY